MSITKEELVQDNRFYIDDWNMDRLLERPVRRIKIKKIKLGNINRYLGLKIMGLQETDVFRYLEGNAESKELYQNYCDKYCSDNNFRGSVFYERLIEDFDIEN